MATTSIWRVGGWLGKVVIYVENPDKTENPAVYEKSDMEGRDAQGLSDVIEYAVQQQKTEKVAADDEGTAIMQRFVSGVNCSPSTARDEMIAVKKRFGKEDGTVAYHGYQSFAPGEADPQTAHEIGLKLAKKLWGEKYQVVVATHLDKSNHLHNHFVVNTVSFVDGIKYHRTEKDYYDKTAEEMADQFGFNEDQREQMAELLADENNSLWSQVLYGISGGDGEIVTVALSQVGNVGGEPYWSWYGFDSRVEWCACFVSWCANECGYIEAGVIPKFAACASQGVPWFQEHGLWQAGNYEPRPGDLIFFDWAAGGQDGHADHVGIVERVENGRVYTVEGNSDDAVRQSSYPIGYHEIYGYGTPAY